jgi:hypothetical protein
MNCDADAPFPSSPGNQTVHSSLQSTLCIFLHHIPRPLVHALPGLPAGLRCVSYNIFQWTVHNIIAGSTSAEIWVGSGVTLTSSAPCSLDRVVLLFRLEGPGWSSSDMASTSSEPGEGGWYVTSGAMIKLFRYVSVQCVMYKWGQICAEYGCVFTKLGSPESSTEILVPGEGKIQLSGGCWLAQGGD